MAPWPDNRTTDSTSTDFNSNVGVYTLCAAAGLMGDPDDEIQRVAERESFWREWKTQIPRIRHFHVGDVFPKRQPRAIARNQLNG